jgi:hypothetical protein
MYRERILNAQRSSQEASTAEALTASAQCVVMMQCTDSFLTWCGRRGNLPLISFSGSASEVLKEWIVTGKKKVKFN